MALSKLEMQQMLREMNVKFQADETTAQLKQRLQQAHHNLWLKSLSGGRPATGGAAGRRLIKKKRKQPPSLPDAHANVSAASDPPQPSPSPAQDRSGRADRPFRPRPIDKPSPGQPWKAAGVGTEPFNRKKNVFTSVIKRAKGCCELCGCSFADDTEAPLRTSSD